MRRDLFFLLIIALIGIPPSSASAAPSELKGKSVLLRWNEDRISRLVGQPEFKPQTTNLELTIYVSTQGRVFNRMKSNSGGNDQVAGQPGEGSQRIPSFSGRSMTIMHPLHGLARRISVDFDGTFTSCTASVVLAKESGAASGFIRAFSTHTLIEVRSATVSGTSCSVREGNVFQ
jgi:hypothetical protein